MNHLAWAASEVTGSHQARGAARWDPTENTCPAQGNVASQAAKTSGAAMLLKRFLHLT